jgi:hypothetical protein|tara:strand:- start:94 stop:984 length:891 start_codon:yes stop_codon:yes gene_type:complete
MPTIDFTTFNEESLRDFKPVLAKSLSPEWWKKMKVFEHIRGKRTQTIRACPAMDDWLKSGWYILANRDMEVCVNDGMTRVRDIEAETVLSTSPINANRHKQSMASPSHPKDQFGNAFSYLGEDGPIKDAFKMRNAWNIITPEGYSCMYLDPFLFQNKYFATWQGIIDTDTFNVNQDNSQIIFYPKVNHNFTIKKGTPLVQIIPYQRENWVATYQLKDSKYWHEQRTEDTRHTATASMDEINRVKYDKLADDNPYRTGAYRADGYWKPKAKMFKEDNPPPECPMHNPNFMKEEKDGD